MEGWKEEGGREERKGETLFENGNELAAKEMSMDRIISGKAKKSLFPLSLSLSLFLFEFSMFLLHFFFAEAPTRLSGPNEEKEKRRTTSLEGTSQRTS